MHRSRGVSRYTMHEKHLVVKWDPFTDNAPHFWWKSRRKISRESLKCFPSVHDDCAATWKEKEKGKRRYAKWYCFARHTPAAFVALLSNFSHATDIFVCRTHELPRLRLKPVSKEKKIRCECTCECIRENTQIGLKLITIQRRNRRQDQFPTDSCCEFRSGSVRIVKLHYWLLTSLCMKIFPFHSY